MRYRRYRSRPAVEAKVRLRQQEHAVETTQPDGAGFHVTMRWDKRYGFGPRIEIPKASVADLRRWIPSDLTAGQWALVAPHIPSAKPGGRHAQQMSGLSSTAIIYLLRTGCQWRQLPGDMLAMKVASSVSSFDAAGGVCKSSSVGFSHSFLSQIDS